MPPKKQKKKGIKKVISGNDMQETVGAGLLKKMGLGINDSETEINPHEDAADDNK
jgi:hypothetical protein